MSELDQYLIESTWSTRATDAIIWQALQGHLPATTELSIHSALVELNTGSVENSELFVKLFSLVLKDKVAKPVQAIATQIGQMAGYYDAVSAFEWGLMLLKACGNSKVYNLTRVENEWYVVPTIALDKATKKQLDKLQYLPPMQITPKPWSNNHNGGWLWEKKHLVLGSRFTKHDMPLAYDVINKLQAIPWQIDTQTYLREKDTNWNLNKKQFLRVIDEYIDKPFHFVWRYDSRGRSYSSGYDLNLQSNEYGKALLSLHNKEYITDFQNLLVAIANHAGKDKLTWEERVNWANGQDPNTIEWEEPILGRKAIRAYQDALDGIPSGYTMSLDATSSGLQIMAALSGCHTTAKLTNMIDPSTRYDVYTNVTDLMTAKLGRVVPRKIAKQCLMTHYYNSKATPKALLAEDELEVFYDAINGLLPGAEDVMTAINDCWDPAAKSHSWVMPDKHTVFVPVVEPQDVTYQDPELGDIPLRYYDLASSDNYRSLCPNVIHSIDGYIAREMIRRCDFQLIHIHDCFRFSPDHLQEVADTYREIMAEIASGDILQDILRQLSGNPSLQITKYSNSLDKYILESEYMLS
jgi:hypothetical protein